MAHVLIFPLPLQGPINGMLRLAEILCLQHINITFIITQHIHRRLLHSSDIQVKYHDTFHFQTVPDGLPEEHPRTIFEFSELMQSLGAVAPSILRKMLTSTDAGKQVSCIIADGLLTFATDIAAEIGIPLLYFDTISPSAIWTYMCLPKLIQAGELPFKDDNLDETIRNIRGMEGIMRRRDLPDFCRTMNFKDPQVDLVLKQVHHMPISQGLILNTFQHLDALVLFQMLKLCPNIYAIGPLHTHLQSSDIISSSIWQEDRSCISWLDKQPSNSVVYVSIGSLSFMTKDEFLEILHGLVSSGSRFLWVRRPGSDPVSNEEIPTKLLRGIKDRGCTVSWAPQREVLAHRAVGGFLTHSGWNSTLESIVAGKPMICWPHYVDQQVNSRYVGEVWRLGLDMKDICDRVVVEKMVREIMELKKDTFLERAREMADAARLSVSEGGSSNADLGRLINDIKNMNLCTKSN
ncbi:7-deoxyloganetic acid glucosyltransferase-like [Salvia miltiorrhiza]|uniref:7-deoxyloganetic acid glucosyltransferase-like n=1 Tax=Salvia miltiorrhiza TaxID=226208 RepID=UPI0025AD4AD2|nr:7-deoxyloganetic acid glucosyltransferase-like [Salvia miltiorrhiza]